MGNSEWVVATGLAPKERKRSKKCFGEKQGCQEILSRSQLTPCEATQLGTCCLSRISQMRRSGLFVSIGFNIELADPGMGITHASGGGVLWSGGVPYLNKNNIKTV